MSWKDYPNLFANGKFRLKLNEAEFDIIAYYNNGKFYVYSNEHHQGADIEPKDCTLIARRIDDMSDEEKDKYNGKCKHNVLGGLIKTPQAFIYLLSIGVYPFDQSHFKTGTVIDINKL